MLDFSSVFTRQQSIAEVLADVAVADLPAHTAAIYDAFDEQLVGLTDDEATFIAKDPTDEDPDADGWNIAHVVVHFTAGLDEWAATAAALARGVKVTERSRYETPWESVRTAAHVHGRMVESRRMTLGYLGVWPDEPDLDNQQTLVEFFGAQNAIATHLLGYMHATLHLKHIPEIRRQAAVANQSIGS